MKADTFNDEIKGRIDRSWEILSQAALEEDFPMEVSIQANAAAEPHGTFLYGRNEITCQHMHRELRKDIGDATD